MSPLPSSGEPRRGVAGAVGGVVLAAAIAVAPAVFAGAGAAEEPTGFAGLPWGTAAPAVREALKARCQFKEPPDAFKQVCPGYTIGNIPGQLTLLFVPGYGLSGWDFSCQPDRAGALSAQVTERFGRAVRDGASRAYWHWPWGSASLYKRECSVSVATNTAMDHIRQMERERARRQKRDF